VAPGIVINGGVGFGASDMSKVGGRVGITTAW
jgi:hypothetical protein